MICPTCRSASSETDHAYCADCGSQLIEAPGRLSVRPAPVHPSREVGAIIEGRYIVQGFLGKGGMARVYVAEDTHTQSQVAIKVLRPEHAGSAASRERFLREVDVAATLQHAHIARIFDAGERRDGCPYLVLELLSGEPLGDVLQRERLLSVTWALELARDTASALVAAHRAGVVHRDVKPDNLFVTVDGRLKVVDFGFAKLKETSVTDSGTTLGTVSYMAPEQALADPVDGRTDVYGLGVSLFHMITGTLPFIGASDARVVAAHLHVPAPLPSARRIRIDRRIDAVILAAMRKNPAHRYPSMEPMLEDLERLLGERTGDLAAPPLTAAVDAYEPKSPTAQSVTRYLQALLSR